MSNESQRGFTLLESLISLSIFLVMLASVLVVYAPSRLLYARGERRSDVQQNARLAMAEISRQVRMAGYFAENFTDTPPVTPLADPILIATDDALVIHGDADGTGVSRAFMFCLDGDILRRGRMATDEADAYTCTEGEIVAERATALSFTYYDVDGNPVPNPPTAPYVLDDQDVGGIPDMGDTTQRGSVRRVVITLTTEAEDPETDSRTYTLTSDVWLRNSG